MKNTLIVLCVASCVLAAFGFEQEKLVYSNSWSLADPVIGFLGIVCLWQASTARWRLDGTALFSIANLLVLGFSALLNGKISNGTTLNFGRVAFSGLIVYVAMSNLVRNGRDLRRFGALCLLSCAVIYGFSIPNFLTGWSAGFTNQLFAFGYVDLNAYGFLFVLLFCATAPMWLSWADILRGLLVGASLASGAFISLSRSAWANLLVASAVIFTFRDSRTSGHRIVRSMTLILAIGVALLVIDRVSQALPGATQFRQAKVDDFEEDAVNVRLVDLTITPIKAWAGQSAPVLMIGDAVSYQHTFLANALWFTGITGLICGLGIYGSMFRSAWLAWRYPVNSEYRLAAVCYLATVAVMVLDDSATNHRYHSQMLSILFFAASGAFAGRLHRAPVRPRRRPEPMRIPVAPEQQLVDA
jgi:hypothetical protein